MKKLTPNDLGKKYLVEDCQKIKIKEVLSKFKLEIKELILTSELESMGVNIKFTTSKTNFNGVRLWFKCPVCGKRIAMLYKHPFIKIMGCRDCLNLDYKKRRYKGMLESSGQPSGQK